MKTLPFILFCENSIEANKVDYDFEGEYLAAKNKGFETLIYSYEDITSSDRFEFATRKIKPANSLTIVIYRGWMLTPKQYLELYNQLLPKNYKLINSPEEYQNCHYLPDSLKFIESRTPLTVFEELTSNESIDRLVEKAKVFKNSPVIIKDYVKSEKHDWESACYVNDASNTEKLKQTINNLIRLRDKYLNKGIVIRKFVELNHLTNHSKSGMPLTEEYRIFFCNKKLLGVYEYWDEGEYKSTKPDIKDFESMATTVESNFFSMDVSRQKSGELIIIELGDGQVSGLPDNVDKNEYYEKLKNCSC